RGTNDLVAGSTRLNDAPFVPFYDYQGNPGAAPSILPPPTPLPVRRPEPFVVLFDPEERPRNTPVEVNRDQGAQLLVRHEDVAEDVEKEYERENARQQGREVNSSGQRPMNPRRTFGVRENNTEL
ncbi:hypothetical protein GGI13_005972, partial [Coemansia sp. RSA 455]